MSESRRMVKRTRTVAGGRRAAQRYLVALDQGTTSCRAALIDSNGVSRGMAQQEFAQHYPRPGWVEHDPLEILSIQRSMFDRVLEQCGVSVDGVAAVGIANQRETTVVWDRHTGQPVHPAIVWQDRRTAALCESLREQGLEDMIRRRTGLVPDAYFSATKIRWLLDHVPGARRRAENGDLLFGTIDTWLTWNLTGGKVHATDCSNASRTMLYDIEKQQWDADLLQALEIPESLLPEVRDSSGSFGDMLHEGVSIPIGGIAGDQQAALFGHAAFDRGMAKSTYGTGCFILMNTGDQPVRSRSGLLTTLAWRLGGRVCYALEGSVFIGGAAIQWLRDGLKIIGSAPESQAMAEAAGDDDQVVFVPAFAGLGAPYWDMYARGAMFGLTRDTGREQIVRATLQSLAFQVRDVLDAMVADSGIRLKTLRVDGGAAANDYLMQFQADQLATSVNRPTFIETTAMGAAGLAGLAHGFWDLEAWCALQTTERTFQPRADADDRRQRYQRWQEAVRRAGGWLR